MDGVPDMSGSRTYYDYEYQKGLTWRTTREEIGRGLRERYEVPKELPPKLLALVRILEDHGWSVVGVSWQDDV